MTFTVRLRIKAGQFFHLVTGKEGVITDTIPAIKADKRLTLEVKKALIALVQALHSGSE